MEVVIHICELNAEVDVNHDDEERGENFSLYI